MSTEGSVLAVGSRSLFESALLGRIRDGRCDNDDATFDCFPIIYIDGCISVMGEVNAAAGRSSFERA